MYKQSPGSRNHRSKGIKVKHVLQVCLLLGVCVWLIYQVKHSHDKKEEIDENDAKFSTKSESSNELVQSGRKDLRSPIEGLGTNSEKQEKKSFEEKDKETEDDKLGVDVVQQEDLVDDERETEENDGQLDDENSFEDHDRDDDSRTSHEAREENYKADESSSAVTHETKVTTEHGEANVKQSENSVINITKHNDTTGLKVENDEADGKGSSLNTTDNEEKGADTMDTLVLNSSRTEGFTDNSGLTVEPNNLFLKNKTQIISQDHNVTVEDTSSGGFNLSTTSLQQGSSSVDMVDNNKKESNLTITESEGANTTLLDSSSISANTDSSLAEKASFSAGDKMGLALPLKDNNATEGEKSYNRDGVNASNTDNLVEAQHDLNDTSGTNLHLEEKHILTDLETHPEIQSESINSKDDGKNFYNKLGKSVA